MSYGTGFADDYRQNRHFYGQDSQGRKASRPAGRPVDQVRLCDQSKDRQGARPRSVADAARPRRRGHQVTSMQQYSMTGEQIDLVRKSFDALWSFRRNLPEQFYGRFFELAPDTRCGPLLENGRSACGLAIAIVMEHFVGLFDKDEAKHNVATLNCH
jgi:hypothetical protein